MNLSSINISLSDIKKYLLVAVIPLTFILMIKPNISNFHYLSYLMIGIISLFIIFLIHRKYKITKRVLILKVMFLTSSLLIGLSALFNSADINIIAPIDILKPVFFSIILLTSYLIGVHLKVETVIKGLLATAYIVILVQLIVGVDQLFNTQLFNSLYYSEKTRSLGSIVRITGTMTNPNTFAWIVTQMTIIIFILDQKKAVRFLFIIIGATLVALSGSRSLFILFPFLLFFCKVLFDEHNIKFFLWKLPIYFIGLVVILVMAYSFLVEYGSNLRYLYQITNILESGSLTSVNSFEARTSIWNMYWQVFKENSNFLTWGFGLGPGTFSSIDNDYLFSLFNYGVVFFILNILISIYAFYVLSKSTNKKLRVLGQQYIVYSLVVGLQAETLSGWNYPVLLVIFLGLSLSQHFSETPIKIIKYKNNINRTSSFPKRQ
ncbi:hypothetical protein VKA52_10015 [Halobacillus sp. HZG1]|uniref:hypothetical protein n=1 Tax=Halobacillus sp. HZG1 TaxID=3111769 RepID=UPI002DB76685|nr:hypothetical protein [Halobacillus sp. HZG1]MEC3884058.1 hypothetical protein [Halobacillus sp. HZG1]